MNKICVIGAGGHSKVVISTLRESGYVVENVFDDDVAKFNTTILGVPIVVPVSKIKNYSGRRAVVAIGSNEIRSRTVEKFQNVEWITVVHPRAFVDSSAVIGRGTVVFAGVVIQAGTRIGGHCIINTGATIDHDCIVGSYTHIAPGCNLGGNVKIGDSAFLGIGSVAIPGISIGKRAKVGAGSVVIRNVSAGRLVFGVPARDSE